MCFRCSVFQAEKRERRGLSCSCLFHMPRLLVKGGWALGAADSTRQQRQVLPSGGVATCSSSKHLQPRNGVQTPPGHFGSEYCPWLQQANPVACSLGAGFDLVAAVASTVSGTGEQRAGTSSAREQMWGFGSSNVEKEKRCLQEQYYTTHSGK